MTEVWRGDYQTDSGENIRSSVAQRGLREVEAILIAASIPQVNGTQMIESGTAAPDFELPDQDGEPVRLSALRGQTVVVYCYPKADTPGTKERTRKRLPITLWACGSRRPRRRAPRCAQAPAV